MLNKKEEQKDQRTKLESFTQIKLKEILQSKASWTPEKQGSPVETGPRKRKRKRTGSRTPPSRRKEQQERRKSPTPTPASKRKKPQIGNKGEEASALETGTLTPVRKLLQKTRKVTKKIGRIEEVQKGRKEGRNTTDTSKKKEGDEGNKDKTKIQNLITKYLSNKDVLTCPRALDSPPAKRRPRAGGTSKAEGRVAGGRKKEGKGGSFLEKWLREGGTNKEAGRSPEGDRGSGSKEEESTQGRKEMLEGRIPATNAEGRDR